MGEREGILYSQAIVLMRKDGCGRAHEKRDLDLQKDMFQVDYALPLAPFP